MESFISVTAGVKDYNILLYNNNNRQIEIAPPIQKNCHKVSYITVIFDAILKNNFDMLYLLAPIKEIILLFGSSLFEKQEIEHQMDTLRYGDNYTADSAELSSNSSDNLN